MVLLLILTLTFCSLAQLYNVKNISIKDQYDNTTFLGTSCEHLQGCQRGSRQEWELKSEGY